MKTLSCLLVLLIGDYISTFQVDRKEHDGDIVFSFSKAQCSNLSNTAVWSDDHQCQCAIGHSIYSVTNKPPQCYSGIGENLGCKIADKNFKSSIKVYKKDRFKNFQVEVDMNAKIFTQCMKRGQQRFELWDRYKGWYQVYYFSIKKLSSSKFSIGWGKYDDFEKYHAGKLFKLVFYNCPKLLEKDCFLFKGLGMETNPSVSTTLAPTKIATTSSVNPATSKLPVTNVSAVDGGSDGSSSSNVIGVVIGVTFFIIFIVGVVVFYIWFRRRHGRDKSIGKWFREKLDHENKKPKKEQSQRGHNHYNGSNNQLPVIPNFPRRPSPVSFRDNKAMENDVYLTPIHTPKITKPNKSTPDDFYDMVADDSIENNVQPELYDAVADDGDNNNDIYDMVAEDLYDIVEENNTKTKSQYKSMPSIIIDSPHLSYNEELPPSPLVKEGPTSYSCLGQVKDNREQYCTLNSKNPAMDMSTDELSIGNNSRNSSIGSQAHLYYETEAGS